MSPRSWICAECDAKNLDNADARFCPKCGTARITALQATADTWLPAWQRPGWTEPKDDDRCTEPDCTKTLRDHVEEFRALVERRAVLWPRYGLSLSELATLLERQKREVENQAL